MKIWMFFTSLLVMSGSSFYLVQKLINMLDKKMKTKFPTQSSPGIAVNLSMIIFIIVFLFAHNLYIQTGQGISILVGLSVTTHVHHLSLR